MTPRRGRPRDRVVGFASTVALAVAFLIGPGLGAQTTESVWRRATSDRTLRFPADHASHPDYRIEWWYYTGNVRGAEGDRFGFQVTFFRIGVDFAPVNPSRWAVRDLYMAHLAVTDVEGQTFRFAERLSRAGVDLAGAATDRYRVWIEDWEVARDAQGHHLVRAAADGIGVDLLLEETRQPVLHGAGGVSRKGSAAGNATHYYSLPRMATRGTLTLDGREFEVDGVSWMDHEFGTSFLEDGQLGWDWLSLQLGDGSELMVFQLRRADGRADDHSSGTLVDANGVSSHLPRGSFELVPGDTWRSATSGALYPIEWRIAVPSEEIDLTVAAVVPGQELSTTGSTGVTYWEGAVDATGSRAGVPVAAVGYLEMTGYAGPPMSSVLR